jgi:hypothetical protein
VTELLLMALGVLHPRTSETAVIPAQTGNSYMEAGRPVKQFLPVSGLIQMEKTFLTHPCFLSVISHLSVENHWTFTECVKKIREASLSMTAGWHIFSTKGDHENSR